ncbi:MAG TPA: hypothetical protein VG123_06200 [Streptosporangiaceae bacterium]|jgi:hypothetical protein|nr:hypothetical protein [Streptosporangiaceae bacterium]
MTSREELDALSSHELHDRAVHRAIRHADIGFLWELLRELPASEAARGRTDLATADITHVSAMISDVLASGEGEIADSLRPLYLDYLEKHGG